KGAVVVVGDDALARPGHHGVGQTIARVDVAAVEGVHRTGRHYRPAFSRNARAFLNRALISGSGARFSRRRKALRAASWPSTLAMSRASRWIRRSLPASSRASMAGTETSVPIMLSAPSAG